ncbi:MAG: PD-(D/E)XK nuclease family protein [Acidobacteriaceae bacterium]|nr:PD-(D/E)XK nuclease family protein [Acidobacteriaceae bacterium]
MDGARELSGDLAERLERGAAVITGNQRAARTLRRAYDHWCHALGLSAWRPPVILAWETWIAALWRQAVLDGHATQLLLTATQEHAIWREILLAGEWKSLRNADSLAAMASEAWSLLCRYNAQHRLRQIGGSADTLAFRRWAQQFVESCQGENFIAAAQLEEALSGIVEVAAATADLSLPKEIVLAGFDTMSPSRMAFIDVIQASGIAVEEISIGTASQKRLLIEAKDEQEETRAAARWIRQYLEEHPHAQIGVIVPNTEERRASVERVFREILAPELENIAATNDSAPYEFSLGVPLIRTPMVATALRLLQWAKNALPLDDISQMLLSRYFAWSEEERGARAEFDAFVLRQARLLRPEATLRWLLARMEGHEKIATLRAAVRKMEAVRAQRFASGERRPYAEWAARIGEFLDAAAWGARNDENSVEYQTRRKWEGALDEFASLDFRAERVEFAEALARLEWIVQNTMFATESRGAAVQVMGPLEAAGSRFDALWFLGAGEFTWPPPARSHPLLPWHLQRECKMPGANRACDDALAARITQRLAESAETVVFSYAAEAERGHQRPSPALAGLDLQAEPLPREPERTPVALERVEDSTPLPPLPDEVIHGGTEVLRLQAACGFRAFAERRLWSTELDENDLGLDAAERGTILHRALQNFWSEVRSQEALKALSNDELEAAILRSVDAAFRKIDSQNGTPWEKSYVDL